MAHRAALRASIHDSDFWKSTPFNIHRRLQEAGRARNEAALLAGWFAERFAREKELRGPQGYIADMLDAPETSAEVQEAMAEAELARMSLAWGLELEDIDDDE